MTQLGNLLRETREHQGLTLEEVEEAIRIRRHLLEALEENNVKVFPSPVITRGMIRNYAKFLKLDPIEALTLYDGNGLVPVKGQRLTPNGIEFMNLSMAPRPIFSWELVIGVMLFLAVMGVAGYLTYSTIFQPSMVPPPATTSLGAGLGQDSALPLPTVTPKPTNTPTPLPPTGTPTPTIYGGVNVTLQITQPSWVQILVDDVKAFEGVLQPGESRNWTGEHRVAVRAGNAGGVEIVVNGISRGLMGTEGQVVDQIWEKVDDPSLLTPQPGSTEESEFAGDLPPTATSEPAPDEPTPLPLQSAPEGESPAEPGN